MKTVPAIAVAQCREELTKEQTVRAVYKAECLKTVMGACFLLVVTAEEGSGPKGKGDVTPTMEKRGCTRAGKGQSLLCS